MVNGNSMIIGWVIIGMIAGAILTIGCLILAVLQGKMKEAISQTIAAIGPLGWIGAFKLLLSHFTHHTLKITPRHCADPIYVRGRTSDSLLLFTIFCLEEYPAKFVKSPRLIIDAGANVGYASIYFACHFPQAEIIAIEPEPSNFEMLKKNALPYKKIRPINAALWSRTESVKIADPSAEKWAFKCEAGGNILGVTMPELLNEHETVDLFKCDIEGAEKEVFADSAWLAKIIMLMIEIHPGCWKPVFDSLCSSGIPFDCRRSGETLIVNL